MPIEDANGKFHGDHTGKFISTDGSEESGAKKGYDSKDDLGSIRNAAKDRKANAAAEDKTTIKEQVKAGMDKLEGSKLIAEIPKGNMITDFNTAKEALRAELEKTGGFVSREGFGDVQVSSRLKQSARYLKTAAEIAAISTVPSIIQKGVLIGVHENHKGRDYASYTFAGKVSVGGHEGIMAVAVKKTTGNFYTVHRVLTPEGKDLKIENDTD